MDYSIKAINGCATEVIGNCISFMTISTSLSYTGLTVAVAVSGFGDQRSCTTHISDRTGVTSITMKLWAAGGGGAGGGSVSVGGDGAGSGYVLGDFKRAKVPVISISDGKVPDI